MEKNEMRTSTGGQWVMSGRQYRSEDRRQTWFFCTPKCVTLWLYSRNT